MTTVTGDGLAGLMAEPVVLTGVSCDSPAITVTVEAGDVTLGTTGTWSHARTHARTHAATYGGDTG